MNIDKEEKKPKFDFAESVGIGDAEITNFNFENRRSASEDGGDMGIDNRVEYNMMVRTHRTGIRKTGNEIYDRAVENLVQLSYTETPPAQLRIELERIMDNINHVRTQVQQKPVTVKKQLFPWKISEDHPDFVRCIYHFILTGNVKCFLFFSLNVAGLGFIELDFLDKLLPRVDGKIGIEIINFLEKIKDSSWCQQQPFMMVYAKCVFSDCHDVSEMAIQKFYIFCDIPSKLFLFVTISEKLLQINKTPKHPKGRILASNIKKPVFVDEIRQKRLARLNIPTGQVNSSEEAMNKSPSLEGNTGSEANSIVAKRKKLKKVCNFKLNSRKLRKCFVIFLELIKPELLLLFLTQDKENLKTEENGWLDFRYLFRHLHPKLSDNNKDSELKNLVITYYLKGIKCFRKKADEYVEQNRILEASANVIISCILEYSSLKENAGRSVAFLSKWDSCSSREQNLEKESMKYFEQVEEYSVKEDHFLYLTFKHLFEPYLLKPEVWITILDDLPYALVLDRIEFIVEHKNLIANVDIIRKVVAILPNVGRAVNAKIHPIKFMEKYFEVVKHLEGNNTNKISETEFHKYKIMDTLLQTFQFSLMNQEMKNLFSTHKRYMLIFNLSTFEESLNPGGKRNRLGLNSLDAMVSTAMCYCYFEEYFHVYVSLETRSGVIFQNIKPLFEKDLDFLSLRKELLFKFQESISDCLYEQVVKFALETNLDVDIFMTTQVLDVRSLEHWLLHYQEEMHRPFTKMLLLLDAPSPKTIEQVSDAKSVYAMAGFNGTTSPHFLNAVVKFEDVSPYDAESPVENMTSQHYQPNQ